MVKKQKEENQSYKKCNTGGKQMNEENIVQTNEEAKKQTTKE